jgi:hypothetical protein
MQVEAITRTVCRVPPAVAVMFFLILLSPALARSQSVNEAFLRSTVLISYQAPLGTISGTGFFLFRPLHNDQGQVLLITNKHVLPPLGAEKTIQIRVATGPLGNATVHLVDVPIVGKDGAYLPNVFLHPAGFDVAAVNVTETIVKQHVQASWVPMDLLSTPERIKSEGITAGDQIFLLGYPSAIYDARNASPILREGVIATVPLEGYAFNDTLRAQYGLPERIDGFLIDANVFPGSSGSLVILKQQPTLIGPGGGTLVTAAKKVPYVLGIVADSIPISDTALKSTQRMGLGVVYSAEAIRDVVNLVPE